MGGLITNGRYEVTGPPGKKNVLVTSLPAHGQEDPHRPARATRHDGG